MDNKYFTNKNLQIYLRLSAQFSDHSSLRLFYFEGLSSKFFLVKPHAISILTEFHCHVFFQLFCIFTGGDGVIFFIKLGDQSQPKSLSIGIGLIPLFMLAKPFGRFFSGLPHIEATIAQ